MKDIVALASRCVPSGHSRSTGTAATIIKTRAQPQYAQPRRTPARRDCYTGSVSAPFQFKTMKFLSVLFLSSFLASAVALAADFQTGQAARITIGQTTFTSQDSGVSASSFGAVSGVAFANNTLFVVDSNHIQAEPVNN